MKRWIFDSELVGGASVLLMPLMLFVACWIAMDTTRSSLVESAVMTEPGEVLDIVYSPPAHGSDIGVGPSINMSGHGGVGVAVVPVSIDIPEEHGILFACTHGKFYIKCDGDLGRMSLWQSLKENTPVTIYYSEVYREKYHQKFLRPSTRTLKSRTLKKYSFKTAVPK